MRRTSTERRSMGTQGFTIMELLVVMGIMAVLITIASISMTDYMRRTKLRETTRDIMGDLNQIRTYARVRQEPNIVLQVTPTMYSAWVDSAVPQNQVWEPDPPLNEPLILNRTLSSGVQIAVASTSAGAVAPLTTIRFTAVGTTRDIANRIFTISMPSEPVRMYRIMLYSTGATSVARSDDGGVTYPTYAW